MKTVWVVEQGSYSDYSVVGVFSSKENAQFIADKINKKTSSRYDEAAIAEWPLDPAVNELRSGLSEWRVLMLRDGTTQSCEREEGLYNLEAKFQIVLRSKWPKPEKDILRAVIYAKDEEHAVKIANEHRTRLIASGEWV